MSAAPIDTTPLRGSAAALAGAALLRDVPEVLELPRLRCAAIGTYDLVLQYADETSAAAAAEMLGITAERVWSSDDTDTFSGYNRSQVIDGLEVRVVSWWRITDADAAVTA